MDLQEDYELLIHVLATNHNSRGLLELFGNVLVSPEKQRLQTPTKIDAGTAIIVGPHVVHAGPACSTSRAVLFCSGCVRDEKPYDASRQYADVTTMASIISCVWRAASMTRNARYLLLYFLSEYVQKSRIRYSDHIEEDSIRSLVKKLEKGNQHVEEILRKTADDETFVFFQLADFEVVSAEGLQEILPESGEQVAIKVFCRKEDSKIVIEYPDKTSHNWEGCRDEDRLTLDMNDGSDLLFNGANGKLCSTDGSPIVCRIEVGDR